MDENKSEDSPIQLHKDLMGLWDRYKELLKEKLTLEAAVDDLQKELDKFSKKFWKIYNLSDEALNEG